MQTENPENAAYQEWRKGDSLDQDGTSIKTLLALVKGHARAVAAMKLGEGLDEVEEAVVSRVFPNLEAFEGRSSFSTWVHRIALNECNTYLRNKRKARTGQASLEELDNLVSSSQSPETLVYIKSIIQSLLPVEQAILVARLSGRTFPELSQELGISPGSLRIQWYRLRKKLKTMLLEGKKRC